MIHIYIYIHTYIYIRERERERERDEDHPAPKGFNATLAAAKDPLRYDITYYIIL